MPTKSPDSTRRRQIRKPSLPGKTTSIDTSASNSPFYTAMLNTDAVQAADESETRDPLDCSAEKIPGFRPLAEGTELRAD
jgi:hypothetical protein